MARKQPLRGSITSSREKLPKRSFYDANDRRRYGLSCAIAAKLIADPTLVSQARQYMERNMRDDPGQAKSYAVWKSLLNLEPQEIAQRLLADTPEGAFLRETRPVFVVLSPRERREAFESIDQLGKMD